MKKLLLIVVFATVSVMQLFAQESSVNILLDNEERFRFDSIRLEFINSGFHVMIGDSTGMNNTANSQTFENTFIGHRAGAFNEANWNTFIGARAGERHISGVNNTYVGDWAGRWDSTGQNNTYIGADAGESNKTGQSNTYIGSAAGGADSIGQANVFIGYSAGRQNKTGQKNTIIGTTCGISNTTGVENTFLGTSAGGWNTSGSYNTYIGRRAGRDNQTGSGNVFLGFYAGAFEMGSDKLYISNSETTTPLIYGDFATGYLKFNAWNVETTGSLTSDNEIRSNYRFNASGNPGINDTISHVTNIDFASDLLKYRTTIYSGGILIYSSIESDWVSAVGEPILSRGMIGMVGEFNGWGNDTFLTRDENNPDN